MSEKNNILDNDGFLGKGWNFPPTLTENGVKASEHHEDYHRQMTQAILDKLDDTELPVLVKTLDALSEFFTGYSENKES